MRTCEHCHAELVSHHWWATKLTAQQREELRWTKAPLATQACCQRCANAIREGRTPGPRKMFVDDRDPCPCGAKLIRWGVWAAMTRDERLEARADGHERAYGDICARCEHNRRRGGKVGVPRRVHTPIEDVAEDWAMLRNRELSQAANIRRIAPRMGMSERALEAAILRAKKIGLIAA